MPYRCFYNAGTKQRVWSRRLGLALIGCAFATAALAGVVEVLVVGGGGGGGGDTGAGGGGGGVVSSTVDATGSYSVTIGGGGAPGGYAQNGGAGGSSSFAGIVANGGGYGGGYNQSGGNGGSGGGGGSGESGDSGGNGGTGNQGGNGAHGLTSGGPNNIQNPGGGGGGAGGHADGKEGGAGFYFAGGYYASGGGGGGNGDFGSAAPGGGGRGGSSSGESGANAIANTGGGGGGGAVGGGGGWGASGVVIVRYAGSPTASGGTITQSGGYTLHTFANGGTFVVSGPAPVITSSLSKSANQGQSVSYQITTSGTPTSYGASSLPSGLSVNTSTGAITGIIPTNGGVQGGNSTVNSTITATNSQGFDSKTLVWSITAASITTNASVSPSVIASGSSVTLTRDGTANFGIAWTENVIWKPDGSAQALGNLQLGSQSYTPSAGIGTYWYQFRLVDTYNNYVDQWISFQVTGSSPTGLQATSQSYGTGLSWNAVSGATGYNVYRNGVKLTGSPQTGTTYTDSNLQAGTTYTYAVTAIVGGIESAQTTLNVTTAAAFEVFTPLS